MSLNNFIPTVWANSLLTNLNDSHVYANCVNRDYEGEIKGAGDVVTINSIGRVTIGNYTKNTWNLTPEVLDGSGQKLTIDQQKYFYFGIDNIDAAQGKPSVMNAFMEEAAWGLSDTADSFLATTIAAGVASANVLTARTLGTGGSAEDAYETLVDIRTQLTKKNTPRGNRWCVVPSDFIGLMLKDPRFSSFGTEGNLRRAMSGDFMETLVGMKLYESNNVPVSGSEYTILAGYKGAVTYAESIPDGQPEALRPEGGFADALKGLHVYGAQVTRPDNLVKVAVTFATAA